MDLKTNVKIWTEIIEKTFNVELNNKLIKLDDRIIVYPKEYFCMFPNNKDNYSIHHFNASWLSNEQIKGYYKLFRSKYNLLNALIELKYNPKKLHDLRIKLFDAKVIIYGYGSAGKVFEEILCILGIINYEIIEKRDIEKNCLKNTGGESICIITIVGYDEEITAILNNTFNKVVDLFDLLNIHKIIG
ncbi:MAG: hypothetical protein ACRCYE_02920 [Sarcina sp.]